MQTATPPKEVTARWVSRRITRSPENRAVISRETDLSEVFASTLLLSQVLRTKCRSILGSQDKPAGADCPQRASAGTDQRERVRAERAATPIGYTLTI